MPDGLLFEIDDISLHVSAGDLAVLTGVPTPWSGLDGFEPTLSGDDITTWADDIRLQAGLFITTGQPSAVPGVRTIDLVHRMPLSGNASDRQALANDWCDRLDLDREVIGRCLDADFTPAEGLSVELLHLALLRPDVAVIDLATTTSPEKRCCEIVNRAIVNGVRQIRTDQPEIAVVVVTNDDDLVAGLTPDHVTTPASTDTDVGRAHRDEAPL